jgi:hypothetical protein
VKVFRLNARQQVECATTACWRTIPNANQQDPFHLFIQHQREQVWHFPHATFKRDAECLGERPVEQIGRGEEVYLLASGNRHHPALGGGVPNHFGIAKVLVEGGQDGVGFVLRPSAPII